MATRPGYYSEQSRTESFKEIINDANYLREEYKKILTELASAFYGDKIHHGLIGQELSERTGIKEHLIFARLNELREMNWVVNGVYEHGENKGKPLRKKNIHTDKMNIVWIINIAMFNEKLKTELTLFPTT